MNASALIKVLSAIADLILFWRKSKRLDKRQAENEAIEKDPAGWLVDELNPDSRVQDNSSVPENAGSAAKTDIDEFGQNSRGRDYD